MEKEIIIKSMLWTDLYKITMGQAVFNNYKELGARYEFINRGHSEFPPGFGDKLTDQLTGFAQLKMSKEEKSFLRDRCKYLQDDFVDWFSSYKYNPGEVSITQNGGDLNIGIEGPWYRTIYWEVPLMTTISELYFKETGKLPTPGWEKKAGEKGKVLREIMAYFIDFGTRRAYSTFVHDQVLEKLIESAGVIGDNGVLLGTSNPYLAMKYDLTPVGTYAHEWVMAHAALFGNKPANEKSMEAWLKEYKGQLGIALSDTFTTDVFLKSFDENFARAYGGVRQDSGNPQVFADKLIKHYESLNIDPVTKKIVFSDGLDIETVLKIEEYCRGKIGSLYGIGTNLTNDVGVKPLNMVIKLFSVELSNGKKVPVVKLSDEPGKESGNKNAILNAKKELGYEN